MSAMPEALDIEMDCTICGRFSNAVVCPVCAAARGDHAAAQMLGTEQWTAVVREAIPMPAEPVSEFGAAPEDLPPVDTTLVQELTTIATQGMANAAVQGAGSMRGGQLASVGYKTAAGYITAIQNGVVPRTHALYLETLRSRFGVTTADIAALNLRGPMTMSDLPTSANPIVHTPTGPGIFDRPRAERTFVVGPKADSGEAAVSVKLEHGQLIAGAMEGTGVLVGWSGAGSITRGAILKALEGVPRVLPPRQTSAKAHAGRVMDRLTREGMVVRVARGLDHVKGSSRWTVGQINHASAVGGSLGQTTMTVVLNNTSGALTIDGGGALADKIQVDYRALVDAELYQSGDITSWLSGALRYYFDAVRFGALGLYVPARHAAAAAALCKAVADVGFGTDWVLPALPIATTDQLRDGIVRGLTSEVDALMARMATERETAKLHKVNQLASAESITGDAGLRARDAAHRLSGDIGATRGQSFLKDLRAIGARIVAYGEVLGEDRLASAKEQVRQAVIELETVLGDDYSGISARFAGVWDEIEMDRKRDGGLL